MPYIKSICSSLMFLLMTAMVSAQSIDNRKASAFNAISVQSGIDLKVIQSKSRSIRVDAPKDIINEIVTEVKNGVLEIYLDKKHTDKKNKSMTVYVAILDLNALSASGGSDITSEGKWSVDKMDIQASGGSDIHIAVATQKLNVTVSGGSDIQIDGITEDLVLVSRDGSDFEGRKLYASDVHITVSGGADAYVHAQNKLVVDASGSSDIYYSGDPSEKVLNLSSSSEVFHETN